MHRMPTVETLNQPMDILLRMHLDQLQVMSPDIDSSRFTCILTGHENYHKWIRGLERVIRSLYAPLNDYYRSESNVIFDDNMIPIVNIALAETVREQFNDVLMGMLRTSTSEAIRDNIENTFDEDSTTDPNIAKTIISELRDDYSEMTLNACYKLVSECLLNPPTDDFKLQQRYCKGMVSAHQTLILYKASVMLATGPADIRAEMLREYGELTTFNSKKFESMYRCLHDGRQTSSAAYIQPDYKGKDRRSKSPKQPWGPCPLCKGKHWKRDCPKFQSQEEQTAHLAAMYPDSDLITAKEHAWMAKTGTQTASADQWYLESGCTSHISRDRKRFNSLDEKPGPPVAGITESVPSSGVGDVTVDNVTLYDTLYLPEAPCNLISISKMTQKTNSHVIFTKSGVKISFHSRRKEITQGM